MSVSRASLALALSLAAAPLLSGCEVDRFFGPRPNAAVSELAAGARADADRLSIDDPHLAALREEQARTFDAEVARLCGTQEDGSTPASCTTDQAEQTEPLEHTGLEQILLSFASLPEESRPLAAQQAIILAEATDTTDVAEAAEKADLTASPTAADAAREVLRREHALAYGVGVAKAFGASDLADLTSAINERIAALTTALEPTGDVPVAEAGYLITGVPSPTDAASAQEFVSAAINQAADSWEAAAAAAPSDEAGWLELAVTGAAHAGRFR
ncbi:MULTISPECIES: hypothetical protein [unclassified Corynebacterium]|uniref:hypothetical protein n=1 Tax=unclassified Corynebacterium TaxID=2624378 RepID=UPI0029CA9C2B|nr:MULTISPECIES: hypothetical protein [unclassified Corynebacterium]WPF65299.1 hypothetical protein OLX12_06840 [Corynebacterium sp. 22KM0430]WPF67794.1 hypothetical protein OLW90_06830 [Corynebacterium sp. 21KM1197]